MRSLHNPKSIFSAVTSLFKGPPKVEAPAMITPADDRARSQEAANAASENERRDAAARAGATSTLISEQVPSSLLASNKKKLGSAG